MHAAAEVLFELQDSHAAVGASHLLNFRFDRDEPSPPGSPCPATISKVAVLLAPMRRCYTARMAGKKKTKKKSTKLRTARKHASPKKIVKRPKKSAKKRSVPKRAERKRASGKNTNKTPKKTGRTGAPAFSSEGRGSRSGEQSGDLQGLSRLPGADSESVDELLDEGNAFEADAVLGVEEADSADEKEVHTHEVPEDDVPEEYLDKE